MVIMLQIATVPMHYMRRQLEISANMRSILIDWLVDVCVEFKLETETFHLAINYMDRFLSSRSVFKRHVQLLGTAALWIAA